MKENELEERKFLIRKGCARRGWEAVEGVRGGGDGAVEAEVLRK